MPPPVYTTRIAEQTSHTGTVIYTAPAGVTVVLRRIDALLRAVAGHQNNMAVFGAGGNALFDWYSASGQEATFSWDGRYMIGPLETITFSTVYPCDYHATAYIFEGVNPYF